jgi:hypothetical protein
MVKRGKYSRGTRRGARKGRSRGLFSRVYSPVSHTLMFGKNSTSTVANTAKGVARMGFSGVNNIGKSLSGHLNGMIRNIFTRKGRKNTRRNRR